MMFNSSQQTVLEHTWPWPAWWTLLLVTASGAFILAIYFRERMGRSVRLLLVGMRLFLMGLVMFMLYEFGWRTYRTDWPEVVVMIDDTASMSIQSVFNDLKTERDVAKRLLTDGFTSPSRMNQAKSLLLEDDSRMLRELGNRHRIKLRLVDETTTREGSTPAELASTIRRLTADQPASPLGSRLLQVITEQRGISTSAIVIFSDGITTVGPTLVDAAAAAERRGIPVYAVGLGDPSPQRNVQVADVAFNEIVFVDELVRGEVSIEVSGLKGHTVNLRVRDASGGEVVARHAVEVDRDEFQANSLLQFRVTERGTFDYVVEASVAAEESDEPQNSRRFQVIVRDDPIRILLVQSYPSHEFQFLKRLFGRESRDRDGGESKSPFRLTTVLQDSDANYVATDDTARIAFPSKRDDLFQYDVLIVGDLDPALLSQQILRNVADFVGEQGHGAVFIAGPTFNPLAYRGTPLEPLFPVDLDYASVPPIETTITESFSTRPTRMGMVSPQMQLADSAEQNMLAWDSLRKLYWHLSAPRVKPGARVLASHSHQMGSRGEPLPIISAQYFGAGMVIFHCVDSTWRWRFRHNEALYDRYWTQTVRYLSRAKLYGNRPSQLSTSKSVYRLGEIVPLRLRIFNQKHRPGDEDIMATISDGSGNIVRRVPLSRSGDGRGTYVGQTVNLPNDGYTARIVSANADQGNLFCSFVVQKPDGEMTGQRAKLSELRETARVSGGKFYTFETAANLAQDLPKSGRVRVSADPVRPLWNTWPIAAAFITFLILEWMIRKRVGLL